MLSTGAFSERGRSVGCRQGRRNANTAESARPLQGEFGLRSRKPKACQIWTGLLAYSSLEGASERVTDPGFYARANRCTPVGSSGAKGGGFGGWGPAAIIRLIRSEAKARSVI